MKIFYKHYDLKTLTCVFGLLLLPLLCSANTKPTAIYTNSIWSMYGGNSAHTSNAAVTTGSPKYFHLVWQKQLIENNNGSNANSNINAPSVTNKMLYVSTTSYFNKQALFAIDARTGKNEWLQSFDGDNSTSGPAYYNGKVFIQTIGSDENSVLHAFDAATGKIFYDVPFTSQWAHYFSPTPYRGNVYIAGGEYGGAYSFNEKIGTQQWFNPLEGEAGYDQWTPAVNDQYVVAYTGSGDITPITGALYVLDRATGNQLFKIQDPHFNWSGYSVNFAPVLDNSKNLALSIQSGYLTEYNFATKSVNFSVGPGYTGQPTLANGVIYAVRHGDLFAVNETTGSVSWFVATGSDSLTGHTPLITNNLIFVSGNLNTYALDRSTHNVVWQYPAAGRLAINEDELFIVSPDSTVHAISIF